MVPEFPVIERFVQFPARDKVVLGGTLYANPDPANQKRAIVLNCGGGISAARYRYFGRFLAAAGIPVFAYDYRGIGQSRPPRLRGFVANAYDWSEYDCTAAIDWLRSRYPNAELIGIGHSIGGMLFGGAINILELSRFVHVCGHTGYVGDYSSRYRLPMGFLWHVLMPALTRVFGYFPASSLGLGEDLPAGVARHWAARTTPDLRPQATDIDASRGHAMLERFSQVRGRALMLSIADDPLATVAGASRLLALLPGVESKRLLLSPHELGLKRIGHFGLISRLAGPCIWPYVYAFLEDNTV
jgi:predicted alpha/beta hydrolase